MLVDVHCHLDHEDFQNDLDEVIKRCREKKLTAISNGVNHESNLKVLELSKKHNDAVKAAIGVYPTDMVELNENEFQDELDFIKKNKDKIIAIGEVGMDLKEIKDLKLQQERFFKIIEMCEKIKKPLIVHSRKAEKEVVDALESS